MTLWIARTTCADEWPIGQMRGLTGPAALPFVVLMSEVSRHRADIFLREAGGFLCMDLRMHRFDCVRLLSEW